VRLRRELQRLNFPKNHFELFGLSPAFALDRDRLEAAYRGIQARIHPDRFAQASDAERRASMQWTAQVNEAYRILRTPVRRARYLLELNGVDAGLETDTAMPQEFLVRQMELRERLEEAKDASALDLLRERLSSERQSIERRIAQRIDLEKDYPAARPLVRELMFFERLGDEVDAAYEAHEA